MPTKLPDNLRAFDDMDAARKWLRDGSIEALKKRFPIEDDSYRLELTDPHYEHADSEYGLKRQKEALLKRGYLADSVKGTWRLVDKKTGNVLDEKQATVMRVPYLTNRGTFIYNGNEYSAASQSRLKHGVYTRKRQSGEIESFYSIKPGTGRNFKMWMEPKTGVFRMNVGQANMPLYPLLKELGVTDKQLSEAWGPEVTAANASENFDARDMRRYYEKFMGKNPGNLGDGEVREAVRGAIMRAEVDPWVVARTLGLENTKNIGPQVLLRGSQKILNVSRGSEQPDDRNAPMFSRILAPEDFIRERIENDAGRVARTLLFKSRRAGNLSRIPAGALDSYTKEYLIKSRLTQPLEETNPLSLLDQMTRVTRMGEGGIGSAEAVTPDARDVNLGQLGFIDPTQGPEAVTIGIDTRVAHNTFKGKDGQMYGEFRDVKTGKLSYLRPEDVADKAIAFPGEMASNKPTAYVSWKGKIQEVPKDQVDVEVPSFGHMMSALTNLNPMPTAVQPARQFYGSKFWGQYMPATKGEVPLVDSVMDDGQTFSEYYGRRVGSLTAKKAGRVVSISDDTMKVRYEDGSKGEIDLVKNLPMNRLTQMSYETQLKPGDTFKEGDLLATNNFVDPKTGGFAMGHNLLVAVTPYKGWSVSGDTNVLWRRPDGSFTFGPIRDVETGPGMGSIAVDPKTGEQHIVDAAAWTIHRPDSKMYCVFASNGASVKVTGSHGMMKFDGHHGLVKCRADELVPGKDVVAVIRPRLPFGTGPTRIDCSGLRKNTACSFELTRDFGWFMGIFLSEGCVVYSEKGIPHNISIACTEADIINKLAEIFDGYGITNKHYEDHYFNASGKPVTSGYTNLYSAGLAHWFAKNTGRYAWGKRIPDIVWTAPREFVDGFIDGYICGDGCVTDKQCTISTSSPVIADGLCLLLGAIGVTANNRRYDYVGKPRINHAMHMVYMSRETVPNLPHITLKRKNDGVLALAELYRTRQKYRIGDVIPVPEGAPYLFSSRHPTVSRDKAIAKLAEYRSPNAKFRPSQQFMDDVQALIDSPLCWSRVRFVEEVESEPYVYDLDMSPYETFVVGYGLVVHNSHEDAQVFSESAAKRLSTNRLYGFDQDFDNDVKVDFKKYTALFPDKFSKEQLKGIGDNGVAKPGTVLNYGDPIILGVGPKLLGPEDAQLGKLSKTLRHAQTDKSTIWEHQYPGVVTDAEVTRKGVSVNVKADVPLEVGDKCCYSPDTDVLTEKGWKAVPDINLGDRVATLDPETGRFEYLHPFQLHCYRHSGSMYRVESQYIDALVTPNHNMFVKLRGKKDYALVRADSVYGKRAAYKLDGAWTGAINNFVCLPAGRRGNRTLPQVFVPIESFLCLLGAFLSGGEVFFHETVTVHDVGPGVPGFPFLRDTLQKVLKTSVQYDEEKGILEIRDFRLAAWLETHAFGKYGRTIPEAVYTLPARDALHLVRCICKGTPGTYRTPSHRFAGDLQRLCLHAGISARISPAILPSGVVDFNLYDVHAETRNFAPVANNGHAGGTFREVWEPYDGYVYCCTMPKWNVIYVRRNGKAFWCGNSTRFGLKGTCSRVIPDDEMPRDPVTNRPYDVLLNPMTILSRVAPNQLMEIGLGKVASRTGKQVRLPQLPPPEGWAQFALDRMKEAGVPEKEDIFDPVSGRTISGVMTGNMYVLPFHHLSEKKLSGRGSSGVAYSSDELPVKGGGEGAQAKRMSGMDNTALLCHGALDVLKDSQVIRGAKQEDYWKALKLGRPLPEPRIPFVYEKFVNLMKAGGINVMKRGSNNLDLLPMTDKDIDELSGGALEDGQMVDKDMQPVKGGLFDTAKAGGLLGKKWTHIDLAEPLPNPVFEEPVRRLLGLSQKQFRDILSGRELLDGEYGGKAFQKALSKIDVDKEIANQKQILRSAKSSKRDNAVKCLGYLTALKKQNLSPKDWIISKVPVLPPIFRPVSRLGDTLLQADINELYRDVLESSKSLSSLRKDLPDRDLQDEREVLYEAVQAAFGLGEPITPEGAAKGLKGALRTITGNGSPKFGFYQSRVLSKPMDMVGRGVISPNPNLDMDSVGIPEDKAWELYKDFILRRLTRNNVPGLRALQMIENREPAAKQALLDEMAYRPVLMDRAPTWHKFNILAYRPYLAKGNIIRVSPLVLQGMNGDFDGDYQKNRVFLATHPVRTPAATKRIFEGFGKGEELMLEVKRGSVVVKEKFCIHALDLQDFPHGELVGRRRDQRYNIDFYEVPKGIYVFAYDEKLRKIVMAEVGGWSVHRNKAMEIVTLSGGEQIYTDDDPRGVYGIDPTGDFGFQLDRMTPSEALEKGVLVPVLAQTLVPNAPKLKIDTETMLPDPDFGIELDYDFGIVCGILVSKGMEPGREGVKEILEKHAKKLKKHELSKLALAVHDPEPSNRHLPLWFRSGGRDFLSGLVNGLLVSIGSVSVHAQVKKRKPELLVSIDSASFRLLQEARTALRMLGVHSSISFSKVTSSGRCGWHLSVSTVDAKKTGIFAKLPDAGMKETFDKADVLVSGDNVRNDFIPVPKSAQRAITKWISQKHHCNLYHAIFESCRRGGYVTRICGMRIKETAEKMQKKYEDDYNKAVDALSREIEKHGSDFGTFKPSRNLREIVLAGIEAVSPYSAFGAGNDNTREARKHAKALSGEILPATLHSLARYFRRSVPSAGLVSEAQYKLFEGMLESPVTWHKVVKVEKTGRIETGYDLSVPGYETFMSDEGVILSNTVNFHIPVSDKAVQNAYDRMLPSKNLISLTDLRESMSNPRQEMALGLYALTRPPAKKAPVRFRTAEEAKAAYRQGKIKANDPIVIG